MLSISRASSSSAEAHSSFGGSPSLQADPLFSTYIKDNLRPCPVDKSVLRAMDNGYKEIVDQHNRDNAHLAKIIEPIDMLFLSRGLNTNIPPNIIQDYNSFLLKKLKEARNQADFARGPQLSGEPPFKDTSGHPFVVKKIASESNQIQGVSRYTCTDVKPFISSKKSPTELAQMYSRNMAPRKIKKNDVPLNERLLVKQFGIFTVKEIKKGECLGVFGGTILKPDEVRCSNLRYLLASAPSSEGGSGPDQYPYTNVESNNMLSRINGTYKYDHHGQAYALNPDGCNIDIASFETKLAKADGSDGSTQHNFLLTAAFAKKDIRAGTELRMLYTSGSEEIAHQELS